MCEPSRFVWVAAARVGDTAVVAMIVTTDLTQVPVRHEPGGSCAAAPVECRRGPQRPVKAVAGKLGGQASRPISTG